MQPGFSSSGCMSVRSRSFWPDVQHNPHAPFCVSDPLPRCTCPESARGWGYVMPRSIQMWSVASIRGQQRGNDVSGEGRTPGEKWSSPLASFEGSFGNCRSQQVGGKLLEGQSWVCGRHKAMLAAAVQGVTFGECLKGRSPFREQGVKESKQRAQNASTWEAKSIFPLRAT